MALIVLPAVGGCSTVNYRARQDAAFYDIISADVSANAAVSEALRAGIEQRMKATVLNSHRAFPTTQARMDIHVFSSVTNDNPSNMRTQTDFSVALMEERSGYPLQIRNYTIYSQPLADTSVDQLAAEAVVSRIRLEYALRQPTYRTGADALASISTRPVSTPVAALAPTQ